MEQFDDPFVSDCAPCECQLSLWLREKWQLPAANQTHSKIWGSKIMQRMQSTTQDMSQLILASSVKRWLVEGSSQSFRTRNDGKSKEADNHSKPDCLLLSQGSTTSFGSMLCHILATG